jgi:PIN domain nuclease of toxin-antitoxin system
LRKYARGYGERSARVGDAVSRKYVLDTHACVFMLTAPRKLGAAARAVISRVEAGRDEAWLPAVAVTEIIMLRENGRLGVGLPELRRAIDGSPSLRFLALDLGQLDEFASLATIRDPFDRLIVSAARSLRATLITRDAALQDTGLVDTIWS